MNAMNECKPNQRKGWTTCPYLSGLVIVGYDVLKNDIHMRRPLGFMFLDISSCALLFKQFDGLIRGVTLWVGVRHLIAIHTEYLHPSGDSLQFSGLCEHFSK